MFSFIVSVVVVIVIGRWARNTYRAKMEEGDRRSAGPSDPDLSFDSARLSGIRNRAIEQRGAAAANPGTTAFRAAEAPAKVGSTAITESSTVVLRKQIPPRDEPSRSWLGGLPRMPADVEWPRGVNPEHADKGAVPLHFIAQLCCADLPAELWDGLGPREGWLLLFVNGNTCDNSDPETWRVLHIMDEGEDRQPPADLGPIHDGVYTGQTAWTRTECLFPRWPVDMVVMPNQLRLVEGRSLAAPDDLAQLLYPEQPINDRRWSIVNLRPFDHAAIAVGLRAAADALARPFNNTMNPQIFEEFLDAANLANLETQWSTLEARARKADNDALAAHVAERRRVDAEVRAAAATPDALRAHVATEGEAFLAWRAAIAADVEAWFEEVADVDPDAPVDEATWQATMARASTMAFRRHMPTRSGRGMDDLPDALQFEIQSTSVDQLAKNAWDEAARDRFAAAYLDPRRRAGLPPETVASFEAFWRALKDNRPHRMGGYHDGLQSDAQPGPVDQLLVMQFAADEGMQWSWGDNGAVYCFMKPSDLEAGAWDRADFQLECH